jgi:hypothetical protein
MPLSGYERVKRYRAKQRAAKVKDPVLTALAECRAGWITDSDLIQVLQLLRSETQSQKVVDFAARYVSSLK